MERVNIAQLLQTETAFEGVYRLRDCQLRTTENGRRDMRLSIEDASGEIYAYIWQVPHEQASGYCCQYIHLRGRSRCLQGKYFVDIHAAKPVNPTPIERLQSLPSHKCPIPNLLARFVGLVVNITHEGLRRLLVETFMQEHIAIPFMQVPASLNYHHNHQGGLLMHSLECATLIRDLSLLSPLEREMGMTAALLHDLGKIKTIGANFSRPALGKAVDHEAITLEQCAIPMANLDASHPELAIDLRHILTCRSIKRWGHEARHPVASVLQMVDRISAEHANHHPIEGQSKRHLMA